MLALNSFALRELPPEERPRERLRREGSAALSATELLALILGSGIRGRSSLQTARDLLVRFGGLYHLRAACMEDLLQVPGLGSARAAAILAALELSRRGLGPPAEDRPVLNTPERVAGLLQTEMSLLAQEELWAVLLDVKHRLLGISRVYRGGLNAAYVRPAEVYRDAIRRNAWAMVAVHNHPSGDPSPSADDLHTTQWLEESGQLLGIQLLDHLIVAGGGYVSLRERGLLKRSINGAGAAPAALTGAAPG